MSNIKSMIDRSIRRVLVVLETIISVFSILLLAGVLLLEFYRIIQDPVSFLAAENAVSVYLSRMLTIVIGLEFIKLLMHFSPANVLEVLIMAISRGIIVDHGSAVDNLLSILCIVCLFAAKRFLIPRSEFNRELDDDLFQPHHRHNFQKNHRKKGAETPPPPQE